MSQLETHQGLPSLLLYRRPASLMETRLMYGQWIRGPQPSSNPLSKVCHFQSGAFSFEMHGATICGRYERHWSITSPRPSFPLDLRGRPPVCVKSERPLKQLCVNRWLSVPQRCFPGVQSKTATQVDGRSDSRDFKRKTHKRQGSDDLIWSIWIWSRYNHAPWTTAMSAQILWTLRRCETWRWADGMTW